MVGIVVRTVRGACGLSYLVGDGGLHVGLRFRGLVHRRGVDVHLRERVRRGSGGSLSVKSRRP
eukprot:339214-Prorocentrum_minimum.AAC.1